MPLTHLASLSDAELASLHLAGHAEAFAYLVQRYAGPLYGYARRLTGNDADAEDMAQETFVRLYANLSKLTLDQPLKPWLYFVCTNLCRNLAKRKKSIPFAELEQPDAGDENFAESIQSDEPSPAEEYGNTLAASHVRAAIQKLPWKYHVVITLFYWDGLSYEEIAEVLSLPLNTVRTHLARAKSLLKTSLHHLL